MAEHHHPDNQNDWVQGLARCLVKQQSVAAIHLDPTKKLIRIASVGDIDEEYLKQCLKHEVESIEKAIANGGVKAGALPEGVRVRKEGNGTIIEKESNDDDRGIFVWRELPWPQPKGEEEHDHGHEHSEDWRTLAIYATICGVLGLTGFILEKIGGVPGWIPTVCYMLSMVAGGYDAAMDVRVMLPKGKLDIHFLMLAVALGAASIEAWEEGALLLFLFSASAALEKLAQHRTRKAIDELFQAAPEIAIVVDEQGEESEVPIDSVVPGMIVLVRPGDQFPVDGEIIQGKTAVDESTITGEAIPVDKVEGDTVSSGTLNTWGVVKMRVLRAAQESSLQKIINLIKEAQNLKAPSQRFTDKFGTPYTYGILGLTIVMFFVWWLGFGVTPFKNAPESYSAFYRAMTLLVVASPCALVLSIPSAILAAIAWGASRGILFRGGAAIEKLSEIDVVALDKTGTLTTGDLKVMQVESFPKGREDEVLSLAVSLEKSSTHPLARAIVLYGKSQNAQIKEVSEFRSITGSGIQGVIDGKRCIIGRRMLLESGPLAEWAKELPEASEEFSEVWVVYEDLIGRVMLQDSIREQSKPVLEAMKALGIKTVMLTGDRRGAAEAVGKQLGLQEVKYGLKPEDKVAAIRAFNEAGQKVAMVGDGVNDAPCLAAAYVPVAMGARGSDAALEQSEVVLMNDRIEYFLQAFKLSKRAKKVIFINLAISLVTIVTMVSGAIFGIVPLTLGVIMHEGSTLLVCLSSLRLLYIKD